MINFIDLENPNDFVINKPEFVQDDEDKICIKSCEIGTNSTCQDNSGYFTVDNLFSELITDYQRLLARRNLGIGDDQTFKWGSIKGNLVNQSDLTNFIKEQLAALTSSINNTTDQKIVNLLNNLEQAKLTQVYYGPSLDQLQYSTSMTITTGNYPGHIYVVVPYEDTQFEVSGLKGGFQLEQSVIINNKQFYVFKSVNTKLGPTKITLSYGSIS